MYGNIRGDSMSTNLPSSHVTMQIIIMIKFLLADSISKIFSNLFRTIETQSRQGSARDGEQPYFLQRLHMMRTIFFFLNIFDIKCERFFFSLPVALLVAGCFCLVNVSAPVRSFSLSFFVVVVVVSLCESEHLNLIFVYELLDCVAYKVYCHSFPPLHSTPCT